MEGADASPVPAVLVAATVSVYAVPLASPGTVHVGADADAIADTGQETVTAPPPEAGVAFAA